MQVLLTKKTIYIDTYGIGKDHKEMLTSWGKGNWTAYPYPCQENLTGKKVNKPYRAVVLENKYLRITVLPQLGGRVRSVFDKAKKKEMFYKPGVIKPVHIAVRGAWMAGGIEFNSAFPHHSVTTMSPVNYKTKTSADRVSVTVGAPEYNFGTEWAAEVVLEKDKPYFETRITLYNPNPYPCPRYFYTNTGLKYEDSIQMFFPTKKIRVWGRTVNYPIDRSQMPRGNNIDYSWLRNYVIPSDIFGMEIEKDSFAVYSHKEQYGVFHVADRKYVPGRKVFTWGRGDEERLWARLLSDDNIAHMEMQSGYPKTQHEIGVLGSNETVKWKERWYPFWAAPKKEINSLLGYYNTRKKLKHRRKNNNPLAKEEELFARAAEAYNYGNMGWAEELFRKSLRKNRNKAQSLICLGIIYYRKGLASQAKIFFNKALREHPGNTAAKRYLNIINNGAASALKRSFLWDSTEDYSTLDPFSLAEFYLELASRQMVSGDCAGAKGVLREYFRKAKKPSPMAYYYLGFCEKDKPAKEACYAQAEKIKQDYIFPHRLIEIKMLEDAIMVNPCGYNARYYLGNLLYYKGRVDEAISQWERSVKLGNKDAMVYRNMGNAYLNIRKDRDKAKKYYLRSVAIDPDNIKTSMELLLIYWYGKNISGGISQYKKMPAHIRNHEYIVKLIANFYTKAGRPQDAEKLLLNTKFRLLYEDERSNINLLQAAREKKLFQDMGIRS